MPQKLVRDTMAARQKYAPLKTTPNTFAVANSQKHLTKGGMMEKKRSVGGMCLGIVILLLASTAHCEDFVDSLQLTIKSHKNTFKVDEPINIDVEFKNITDKPILIYMPDNLSLLPGAPGVAAEPKFTFFITDSKGVKHLLKPMPASSPWVNPEEKYFIKIEPGMVYKWTIALSHGCSFAEHIDEGLSSERILCPRESGVFSTIGEYEIKFLYAYNWPPGGKVIETNEGLKLRYEMLVLLKSGGDLLKDAAKEIRTIDYIDCWTGKIESNSITVNVEE